MVNLIKANDPNLKSWVEVPYDSDFPIQNLPFGIFSTEKKVKELELLLAN